MHEKKKKGEESKEIEEVEEIMDVSMEKNKELLKKLAEVQKAKCLASRDAPQFKGCLTIQNLSKRKLRQGFITKKKRSRSQNIYSHSEK